MLIDLLSVLNHHSPKICETLLQGFIILSAQTYITQKLHVKY